jgi:hypothetical protein
MVFPLAVPVTGAFIHFAFCQCDSHFASHESSPASDASYLKLKDLSITAPCASANDLEQLADCLVKYSNESTMTHHLLRLADLCYAATSMFGDPSPQVQTKLRRVEAQLRPAQRIETVVVLEIAELARDAFRNQVASVAYCALIAAIRCLEKDSQ